MHFVIWWVCNMFCNRISVFVLKNLLGFVISFGFFLIWKIHCFKVILQCKNRKKASYWRKEGPIKSGLSGLYFLIFYHKCNFATINVWTKKHNLNFAGVCNCVCVLRLCFSCIQIFYGGHSLLMLLVPV